MGKHHPDGGKPHIGRFGPLFGSNAKKTSHGMSFLHWRRRPESDRGIKVLQTSALPLGYDA